MSDQYARLYAPDVVAVINALNLPRYGLANYVAATPHKAPTPTEAKHLQDLSRAGRRLMGFCRTNLFKRLESSGEAFQQSIDRHILRNYVFLHAIQHSLPLPLGTQDAGLLDAANYDEDVDDEAATAELFEDETGDDQPPGGAWLSAGSITSRSRQRSSTGLTLISSSGVLDGCGRTCSSTHLRRIWRLMRPICWMYGSAAANGMSRRTRSSMHSVTSLRSGIPARRSSCSPSSPIRFDTSKRSFVRAVSGAWQASQETTKTPRAMLGASARKAIGNVTA